MDEVGIRDHLLQCLNYDLYSEWAKVLDQSKQITDWVVGLYSLWYKLEQLHKLEQASEKSPMIQGPLKPNLQGRDKEKGKSHKLVAVLSASADSPPEPFDTAVPLVIDGVRMTIVDSGQESDSDLDIY